MSLEKTEMSLEEIKILAENVLLNNGCNQKNALAIAETVFKAERDGSESHGLFRIPGYVNSLKSGKVKGDAEPSIENELKSVITVDGNHGYAPLSLKIGLPYLTKAALSNGIAVMKVINSFHFAALWPETEYLAENNLVSLACTAYKPSVAPYGTKKPFFGTNPISFAWPRPGKTPFVFDMATSTLAKGDVMVAARDGHEVPDGTGLGPDGRPTNDPNKILKGVLLPFGGYKGSAVALMVELLSAGLTGDYFSYEAEKFDNNDGGPAKGGELIIALNPEIIAGKNWVNHSEDFFKNIQNIENIRLPGERRHKNRMKTENRLINSNLLDKIKSLNT